MVNGRNDPWKPKTQKHIDRIRASDIANGVVSRVLRHSSRLTSKGVWQRGAQSHECNGRHGWLQTDQTTENGGQIANNGG